MFDRLQTSHVTIFFWLLSHLFLVYSLLLLACPSYANNVAVIVGNSHYDDPTIHSLQFADDDARLFAHTLLTSLHFKKEDIRLLTSQPKQGELKELQATAANIHQAITDMANKQANATQSTFLFFASAHGVETSQGVMLAVKDYDSKQPLRGDQAELTAQHLSQCLSGLKSGLVVALLDICRKDGLIRSEREIWRSFVLPSGNARRVATLFSSSEGPSFECGDAKQPAYGHGYFTYYVCRGLSKREQTHAGLPIVGALDERVSAVTLQSLHNYVRWNLLEQTHNLPGAGGAQVEVDRIIRSGSQGGEPDLAGGATSGLDGQLPELVCGEAVRQSALVGYERGSCRAEISLEDRYAVLRNEGLDLYEAKDYAAAGMLFDRAYQVKEEGFAAFVAGLCYENAGKAAEAAQRYRIVLKTDPKNSSAMNNLGNSLVSQGILAEAEPWFRKAIETNPNHADTMYNLGLLLQKRGKVVEAEQWYRKAIEANPKYANAMNNLGALFYDQGKVVEAGQWFRKAIEADPKHAPAMTNLGVLLGSQGKVVEAEQWFRKAIEANPKYAPAKFDLAKLFYNQGKKEEAEQWYRKVIETNPKYGDAMTNLGMLLYVQGKKEEAEQWWRKAIEVNPKDANAMNNLGKLLNNQGKKEEAEQWYRKAIWAMPNKGLYHANLADLLFDSNHLEEALIEAKRAQELGLKEHPVYDKLGMKTP